MKRIEKAVAELSAEKGVENLTREEVCARAGISQGTFKALVGMTWSDYYAMLTYDGGIRPRQRRRAANPKDTKRRMLAVAVELAKSQGYHNIRIKDVAEASGFTPQHVGAHFGTLKQLRRAVIRQAVAAEVVEVVAQGLAAKDKYAIDAPEELKARAVEYLAGV